MALIEAASLQKAAVRRAFDRAAPDYDRHAALQQQVALDLIENLDFMDLQPAAMLDLGAGTGFCSNLLRQRYPGADLYLLDIASQMLMEARRSLRPRWFRRQATHFVTADAERLPFADASLDLVVSSLSLQWCTNLDVALKECRRILRPRGLLLFSTLGPDTLHELRAAFANVDGEPHVNVFLDLHDIGDALVRSGFSGPVITRDLMVLDYPSVTDLMRALKGIGATNSMSGRARGLFTRHRLEAVAEAYEHHRRSGQLPATYEVVTAHAWCPQATTRPQDGSTVAAFPVDQLRGSRIG